VQPDDIDAIYRSTPLDKIPWNMETPPAALVELVNNGTIRPCKTIDLGCGAGNYAIYLATLGFEVTGVDISPAAIRIAEENAKKRNARCRFVVADLLDDLHEIEGTFDFAFDYGCSTTIFPEDRDTYIRNVYRLLNTGSLYLSVCFSENDPHHGSSGKVRKTPLGTTLYFSSEPEIRDLVSPFFAIRELKTIGIAGKHGPHAAVFVLAQRR